MNRYYSLTARGLHRLSAGWQAYLPSNAPTLPTLTSTERILFNNLELLHPEITVDRLRAVFPYLLPDTVSKYLKALSEKGVLELAAPEIYRHTTNTQLTLGAQESAMVSFAETFMLQSEARLNRLAILTTALIDAINRRDATFRLPCYSLATRAIRSSERAMGQIQQRLGCLMAYHDDAHIAAWQAEEYNPQAVRVAAHLYSLTSGATLEDLLKVPLFPDQEHIQEGLMALEQRGDLLYTGVGYVLTAKGMMRFERMQTATELLFEAAFEQGLSGDAREEWQKLMIILISPSSDTTIVL